MININRQRIKELLEKSKKLVLKKALPFVLATGFVVGTGTTKAEAANVEFPTISITYNGNDEYVNEDSYISSYVTDRQAKELNEIIEDIDNDFQDIYTVLANGGMFVGHTGNRANSMARMLASINMIETEYESVMDDLNNTEKQIIKKYLESKINESKLVFSSVTNISVKDLEDYADDYTCVFANSIGNNSLVNIGVYELKNNQIVDSRIITLDDSKLSKDKTLVVIPNLVATYGYSSKPTFRTEYNTAIIPKDNEAMCLQAMRDTDIFYDKIEKAIESGNYTASSSSNQDVILSIYGDTNLISETINTKYAYYTELSSALNQYLNYKQSLMVSKVYNENSNRIDYRDYIEYSINNKPVRISEEQGFVYYKNGNEMELAIDRGYLDTSDLKSSVTPSDPSKLENVTIDAYMGVNIYVDGVLFTPRDANGNKITPFVHNGTTYLPIAAISTLYGADVEWKNNSVYIEANDNTSDTYYIDENGNKVYFKEYPAVPVSGEQPNAQLTQKKLSGVSGVNIYFNGNLYTPQPTNGKKTEVYIIHGTTYIPARDISAMFGTSIGWDQATNSAILNRYGYTIDNGNDYNNGSNYDGAYYYDENGNRIYIGEDEYEHIR